MEYLWFLAGVLLGSALSQIIRFEFTSFGVLKIDHENQVCWVQLNKDCIKTTKKKVVLEVDHNATSQD